ncbi:MAG: VOC family protein [Chloroflexi bacterium]|nr:VOC family protein [Chloroflexota bacterium]
MHEGIWYIVVAVKDVAQAAKDYEEKLGLKASGPPLEAPQLGIKRVVVPLGETGQFIELAEPLGENSAVGRTLERRGEGIHTVTLAVDDVRRAAEELKARGVRVMEVGAQVFIHPADTHGVLWQLRVKE